MTYSDKTDQQLLGMAQAWAMTREARAAQEWSRYTISGRDDNGTTYQLTAPARHDEATGQMEQAAWTCDSSKRSCDCPDAQDRLRPMRSELWKRGFKDLARALTCKHVLMLPLLWAEEEAKQQDRDQLARELERERQGAQDLAESLTAAAEEIARLNAELAAAAEREQRLRDLAQANWTKRKAHYERALDQLTSERDAWRAEAELYAKRDDGGKHTTAERARAARPTPPRNLSDLERQRDRAYA